MNRVVALHVEEQAPIELSTYHFHKIQEVIFEGKKSAKVITIKMLPVYLVF